MTQSCSVYFIQCTLTGRVKIGSSREPEKRMREMAVGAPAKLRMCATAPLEGEARDMEAYYHDLFGDARLRGEWFRPSLEITDEIKRLGGSYVPPHVSIDTESEVRNAADDIRRWRDRTQEMADDVRSVLRGIAYLAGFDVSESSYRHRDGQPWWADHLSGAFYRDLQRARSIILPLVKEREEVSMARSVMRLARSEHGET